MDERKIIWSEKASRGAFTGWRKIPNDADHARYRWFYPIDRHVLVQLPEVGGTGADSCFLSLG
ncbi:MAG: hypothetical protein ACJ8DT_18800, partial [Microvirga sp.]